MKLIDIVRDTVKRMAGVTVDVEASYDTVSITDDAGHQEEIFLQGDDAHAFITEAQALYEQLQHIGMDEAYLYLASPYVENLWN